MMTERSQTKQEHMLPDATQLQLWETHTRGTKSRGAAAGPWWEGSWRVVARRDPAGHRPPWGATHTSTVPTQTHGNRHSCMGDALAQPGGGNLAVAGETEAVTPQF